MIDIQSILNNKKFLIGTSVVVVILVIIVLSVINRKEKPTQPSDSTYETQGITKITPRVIQGGAPGGSLNVSRKPTKSPSEVQSELIKLTPIEGDGFIITYDSSKKQYIAYISAPFSETKSQILLWISQKYPSISTDNIQYINMSALNEQSLPHQGEGFVLVPGATDNSYIAYISEPYSNSENNAQIFVDTSIINSTNPTIEYVPLLNNTQSTPQSANNPTSQTLISVTPSHNGYQALLEQNQTQVQNLLDNYESFSSPQPTLLASELSQPAPSNQQNSPSPSESTTNFNLPATEIAYPISTVNTVKGCLPNFNIYRQVEAKTGVPWKVIAGIHYVEGSCGSNKSCVSGRTLGINEPDLYGNCRSGAGEGQPVPLAGGCGFRTLLDSCIYGANHLKGKIGGRVPTSIEDLAKALGRYNGLGNANCGRVNASMPYCPAKYEGYDHIYPMSKYDSIHQKMYLVYCADYTKCNPPKEFTRIGVLAITQILTKLGY